MRSSWEHTIYSLRYKKLDSIKLECKEGFIRSKTYYIIRNYYTIKNKETLLRLEGEEGIEASLRANSESRNYDLTIEIEKQWYEYTDWHDRHKAYLKTDTWQEKKRRALERADHKCQLCSSYKQKKAS